MAARGVGNGVRRPVSRVLSAPFGVGRPFLWDVRRRTPHATNPGDGAEKPLRLAFAAAGRPYSVLLPVGFTLPPLSPGARCALTAPFHPCPRSQAGGLFSVALSLGSPPPAVSRHRFPVEPGLSSTVRLRPRQRPSSRLTARVCARGVGASSAWCSVRWRGQVHAAVKFAQRKCDLGSGPMQRRAGGLDARRPAVTRAGDGHGLDPGLGRCNAATSRRGLRYNPRSCLMRS